MSKKLRIPASVKTFGEALRWTRTARRMTLRQLGSAIGVSAPFLSDIEHDRRTTTGTAQIAEVLNVELADLEQRQGWSEDLKDWLDRNPKLIALLRSIRRGCCKPVVLKQERPKP